MLVGIVHEAAEFRTATARRPRSRSILEGFPWLRQVFADGGYAGEKLRGALKSIGGFTLGNRQAVGQRQGFDVLPRRWVVERTFAWLRRCRRLAKDFERSIDIRQAWLFIASIRLLTRRLARA